MSTEVPSDFIDTQTVDPNNVHLHGVIINVPLIYVSADDIPSKDRIVPNLRVVKYEELESLITIASRISSADKKETMELSNKLLNYLISHKNDNVSNEDSMNASIEAIADYIKFHGEMTNEIDLDDDYVDPTTDCISFDVIRQYIVNPENGVLVSAENTSINGYQLYSQLPEDRYFEHVMHIRQLTNDTDYMRMQYYLSVFEKILTFQPGYCFNSTMKITNLSLFYLCLYTVSMPIDKLCSYDIKSNMIGYMIDLIARSRCIQAWQRDDSSKKLLKDMILNHNNENHIIQLCQLPTPKQRANYILNLLAKKQELKHLTQSLTYDMYTGLLEDCSQHIENETYYLFDNAFIIKLMDRMPSLQNTI